MVLQIEKPEVIELVEQLARRTGVNAESAIEIAVRGQLQQLETPEEREQRWEEVQALAASLAARFKASGQPLVDHGDLLYGEDGLPK
jgi:hypothetical protein